MDKLIEQVQKWAVDKELHIGDPFKQFTKTEEEVGEIGSAMLKGDPDKLVDGIGDAFVTLIILAMQHEVTPYTCLNTAFNEIKDRKGKTIDGTFIKESDLKELEDGGIVEAAE